MIHKLLTLMGVLTCLGVGVTTADQPILSPWQALNPPVENPAPYDVSEPQEFHQESFGPTHIEPADDTDLSPEEEFLISNIPFKLPFKMEKKQLAVAMKLLKEAVKPIVKSKTLRVTLAYFDDLLSSYNEDPETQMYMKLFLDSLQDMYEGKEAVQFNKILKGIFNDLSDEETARTLDDMWRSTLDYVYDPVKTFVMRPMRSLVLEPLGNAVSDFAGRIGFWAVNTPSGLHMDYPESFDRWSEAMNLLTRRLSNWSSQARSGIEYAARVLEVQDEGHSCADGCGSLAEGGFADSDLSVEVMDVTWLVWLAGGLVLVSIIAVAVAIPAIAIPLAVGIPLGIAGGDDFDDYTGFAPTASIPIPSFASPPVFVGAPAFRPAPTLVTGPAVGGATAFGTAPVGGVTALETAPAFVGAPPPGQHAVFINQPFTNRRGDSSPDQLSHSVEKSDYSSQEESKLIMKLSEEVPHKLYSKYKPSSESTRPSPLTTERKQSHSGQSKTK